MKATEWFATAATEGAFCGREWPGEDEWSRLNQDVPQDFKPVPVDRFVDGKWICIWSDTGLPYNPKVHGGRQ